MIDKINYYFSVFTDWCFENGFVGFLVLLVTTLATLITSIVIFLSIVTSGQQTMHVVEIEGHKYIRYQPVSGHGGSIIHAESCPCKTEE